MCLIQFSPMSLPASFSKSFSRNFRALFNLKPAQSPRKCFSRNLSGPRLACYALDDTYDQENEGTLRGTEFLLLIDERGIRANSQTYLWLLDLSLNSGNFIDCKKLHGKILKEGFDRESALCDKLIDFYLVVNDLNSVVKVFDDMPSRSVFTWNKVLSNFAAQKMSNRVLDLFLQMLEENLDPSEITFASVLRACGCGNAPFLNV